MNAGMYGMPSGQGGQMSKLIGIAGKNGTPSPGIFHLAGLSHVVGAALNSVAVSNGVRVRALNISGKGVLKLLAVADSGIGTPAYRVELFVDGSKIIDSSWTHNGSSHQCPPLLGGIGNNTYPAPFFEDAPFSSTVEVFVTMTGVGGPANMAYLADLYQ